MIDDVADHFAAGRLPTAFQLRSALQVGRLIDETGTPLAAARNSYRFVPTGGLYRSEDLIVGEGVLRAAGLLSEREGGLFPAAGLRELAQAGDEDGCEALLYILLAHRLPLWLRAATSEDIFTEELVPDEVRDVIKEVLDPASRERLLLELGRRYSPEERSRIGALAEKYVVRRCKEELQDAGEDKLASLVRQVSQVSDQLGYDITAPRLDYSTRRVEVKGTRSGGTTVAIYLSRNEAERGATDLDWVLVACRVAEDDSVELVGWLSGEMLEPFLPEDPQPLSRWQSVRIDVPEELFLPGLPPI